MTIFIILILFVLAIGISLSFFIPWGICKLLGIFVPAVSHYGKYAGLVVLCATVSCVAFGALSGWRIVKVRHVAIGFEDLPASFDGYRIAHLSDWHLGTYSRNKKTIEREVRKVLEEKPDLIVFTGDMVNYDPSEIQPFTGVLSELNAPDGVWSVMGNHDYCMYNPVHTADAIARYVVALQKTEKAMGWNMLLNENTVIRHGTDSIALIGVENDGKPPFPQYADLEKAQAGLPEGIFKILLSHDPTHWRRAVLPETDINLMLAGHTHSWQFRLWGLSPCSLFFDEWAGLYSAGSSGEVSRNDKGSRKLYISTGAGGNIPFRFGAWPEVVIITLRKI